MEHKRENKSFHYKARTTWRGARQGVLSGPGKPDVVVGSPPEWKGRPDNWAPEELLVASVNSCIMLTFLTLAQGRGVTLVSYESDAEGELNVVDGVYQITSITVRPRVIIASEAQCDAARDAMEHVEGRCFMSQSVKAKVTLIADVSAAASSH
jgi:organic hydroperoxide reductase OsmC/OhrA